MATEQWYENEFAKKDSIQQTRIELAWANKDIDKLKCVQTVQYNGHKFNNKPSDEISIKQLLQGYWV